MDQVKWNQFIDETRDRLTQLRGQDKLLIDSLISGVLLSEKEADDIFSSEDLSILKTLINSSFLTDYSSPVLVDMDKAVQLYKTSSSDEAARIETAILMSRVNFMGTDGIRGKVVLETEDDFITALLKDNAFTPELVRVTSYAFAQLLMRSNVISAGDTVVIGNDGRDKAYGWALNRSVVEGFSRAGLDVLDTGVVPTAVVPWKMLQLGHRAGGCLTASHNPSNQNGIKFFIDGAKLLPEGNLGDYALSALMYTYCRLVEMPEAESKVKEIDVIDESVDFFTSVMPADSGDLCKDLTVVFDSANGASDKIGRLVFEKLGINYISTNEEPTGDNINRQCGVAEIEGTEFFKGDSYDSHIPFVQKMFDLGREKPAGTVWGVPLDGDGDRGFLMYYDKRVDTVYVLDGDKCGYILAKYLINKGAKPQDNWFISTIESDLMTANAAAQLGLNTKVVSVGDKWIGNFTEGQLLVGLEISGHLIFPIAVKATDGTVKSLCSGVGILTGLYALVAVRSLGLTDDAVIEPFEPGFSHTYYVYFVDKARHYRGSEIWNRDKVLLEDGISARVKAGQLPSSTTVKYEDKEDPHVLYANISADGELLGSLFMRNSGTEDKNATYVKGQQKYESILASIGKEIQKMHTETMKNESRLEYKLEKALISLLENGDTTIDEALNSLSTSGIAVSETDLFGVVYGLKKEGRINLEGRSISKK